MATCIAWLGFLMMMSMGFITMLSTLHLFPFSSAPLLSSYSSGASSMDIPLPFDKQIKGQWNQGTNMIKSNEKIAQAGYKLQEYKDKVPYLKRNGAGGYTIQK